jgi:uncharacterized membrane protein
MLSGTISAKTSRFPWFVVVATAILAARLIITLHLPNLWIDEKIVIDATAAPNAQTALTQALDSERRPPLFNLMMWGWRQLAGDGEWQIRLLPALFAALFVPAVYALTRRLFGRRAAGFAAALCAMHPLLLSYGQIVRYYTFVAALAALSYAAFLGIRRGRATRRDWVVHFAATSGLLLSDYPAYAVLLAQNLLVLAALLRRSRIPLRGWLISHAVWLVVCVPIAATALLQSARDFGAAELSTGLLGHVLKVVYAGFAWSIGEYLFPWRVAAALGLAASVALLVTGLFARRSPAGRGPVWMAVTMLAVPLAVSLALLATVARDSPFVNSAARTMSAFAPFIAICAHGAARLPARAATLLVAGLLVAQFQSGLQHDLRLDTLNPIYTTPAREAAQFIAARVKPGDIVVTESDALVERYLPPSLRARHFDVSRAEEALGVLVRTPDAGVWFVQLGRDRTRNDSTAALIARTTELRPLVQTTGLAEQDATYRQVKERLLNRPAYAHRLTITQLGPRP